MQRTRRVRASLFMTNQHVANGAACSHRSTGTNGAALRYGGGADFKMPFKVFFPLVLHGKVRDFFTGQPRLNIARSGGGHKQL
jgi:hypothetical protein